MSIKQGEYLKKLRMDNSLSQEQLAEKLGISRQSVSKWEQRLSTPDTDNFVKLSRLYGVAVDSLINGEDSAESLPVVEAACLEDGEPYPRAEEQRVKRKRGWFFVCYPILTVILYAVIGAVFKGKGVGDRVDCAAYNSALLYQCNCL